MVLKTTYQISLHTKCVPRGSDYWQLSLWVGYNHVQKWNLYILSSEVCLCFCSGNYRTQLYDKQREEYLPATQGLGMFVEVKDPDEKVNRNNEHSRVKSHKHFIRLVSLSRTTNTTGLIGPFRLTFRFWSKRVDLLMFSFCVRVLNHF